MRIRSHFQQIPVSTICSFADFQRIQHFRDFFIIFRKYTYTFIHIHFKKLTLSFILICNKKYLLCAITQVFNFSKYTYFYHMRSYLLSMNTLSFECIFSKLRGGGRDHNFMNILSQAISFICIRSHF